MIIQIYNNWQVLWNSKVKFVSLSQLLGWHLFESNSGPFSAPGFIFSVVGIKKGRKEVGIKKGKKERKKEWKNKTNQRPPAGFKQGKPVPLVFLAIAGGWRIVSLFSLPMVFGGCRGRSKWHSLQLPILQPSSSVHLPPSALMQLAYAFSPPVAPSLRCNLHTTSSLFAVLDARDSQNLIRVVQPPHWVKSFWGLLTPWTLQLSSAGASPPSS